MRVQGLQVRDFVVSGIFSHNCANSIILDCVADGGRSPFANGEFPFNKFPGNFKVHWNALDFDKPPKCVLRDLSCVDCNVGVLVSSTPEFKESSNFEESSATIYNVAISNTKKSSLNFETIGRIFIGVDEQQLPAGNSNVVINSSPDDDGGKIHVANGTIEASFYGIDMFDDFFDFNLGQLASCRVENCNIVSDLELIDDGNGLPPPAMLHNPLEVVGCTVSAPNADVAIRLANPGGGVQTRVINTTVDAFLEIGIDRPDEVSGGSVIINQTNGGIGTAISNAAQVTDTTIVYFREGIFRSLGDLTLDNVQILNTKANPVRMPVGGEGYNLTVTNSYFENFGLDTFEDDRRAAIFGIFDPQSAIIDNNQFVRTNFVVPECCKRSIRFQPGDVSSFCGNQEIDMQLPPIPANLPCPPSIN